MQSREEKKQIIASHMKGIMETLELDMTDPSLIGTPDRVAKMYVDEVFSGLWKENEPKIMTVPNDMGYDQMIIERDIRVQSTCEHHFCPVIGVAHIAYIPDKTIIGLSKLNRIVEHYSRRPQLQERLTEQIHKKLMEVLGTKNVAVIVNCQHYCVIMRGIRDQGSSMITSKINGHFNSHDVRNEFLDLVKLGR
jgi:GTP cyclohydrolase I